MFLAGARLRYVILMTVAAAALFALATVFSSYRMRRLTGFLDTALRALLPESVEIITPSDPNRRGCQLSVRVKQNAQQTFAALG